MDTAEKRMSMIWYAEMREVERTRAIRRAHNCLELFFRNVQLAKELPHPRQDGNARPDFRQLCGRLVDIHLNVGTILLYEKHEEKTTKASSTARVREMPVSHGSCTHTTATRSLLSDVVDIEWGIVWSEDVVNGEVRGTVQSQLYTNGSGCSFDDNGSGCSFDVKGRKPKHNFRARSS